MHEYIDKRKLLRTPSERQRLLEEVPRIIPDVEDSKDSGFLVMAANKSSQRNTGLFLGLLELFRVLLLYYSIPYCAMKPMGSRKQWV